MTRKRDESDDAPAPTSELEKLLRQLIEENNASQPVIGTKSPSLEELSKRVGESLRYLEKSAPINHLDAKDILTIEGLVGTLSSTQKELADRIMAAGPSTPEKPVSEEGGQARVAAALERIRGTVAHELRSLTEPEQHELLGRMSAEIDVPLFLRGSSSAQPSSPPEQWGHREPGRENPVQFIRRVYAAWLGRGLSRRQLRNLDPALYRAFSVWVHRHPDDAIPELPSMSDETDLLIETLSRRMSIEELRRLGYAIDQRLRKPKKISP